MGKGYITNREFETRQHSDLAEWQRRIKRMMEEKKCRAYTLAKGTGMSRSNLTRLLNTEQYPNLNTMSKIHLFLENYEK